MNKITIPDEYDNSRFDRYLKKNFPDITRSEMFRFIRSGKIKLNRKKIKPDCRLKSGDTLELFFDIDKKRDNQPKSLHETPFFEKNFNVVYEDEYLIVCNKPAGIVVHSGAGHKGNNTLIDMACSYVTKGKGGKEKSAPMLVHRLDRDTSGVIVLSKNKQFLKTISKAFAEKEVTKQYVALCHGKPPRKHGFIETNLAKVYDPSSGTRTVVQEDGEIGKTEYRLLRSNGLISTLQVTLHTGKMHQIRAHLSHIGCPILGDSRYGDTQKDLKIWEKDQKIIRRLYLHAEFISFYHPDLQQKAGFSAQMPQEFIHVHSHI